MAVACDFYQPQARCENVTVANCTFCNTPSRNSSESLAPFPTNIKCFPAQKSCQVCGALDPTVVSTQINTGYSLVLQQYCDANFAQTEGTVQIAAPTLLNMDSITVTALPNVDIVGVCPVFIFDGSSAVTLSNLDVDCTVMYDTATAAAILLKNSPTLMLNVTGLSAANRIKSALTVLGGVFDFDGPIESLTDLGGTTFDTLSATTTVAGIVPSALSLAMFYSDTPIIINNLEQGHVIIQPGKSPSGEAPNVTLARDGTITATADAAVSIINVAEYLDDFGSDYETQVRPARPPHSC